MSTGQQELFPQNIPPWELDAANETLAATVVFSEAPHGPYDYRIPDRLLDQIQAGMRVKVPLGKGNREMLGYCIQVAVVKQSPDSLKPVLDALDVEPLCTGKVLELMQWMSRYYIAPLGQIFVQPYLLACDRVRGASSASCSIQLPNPQTNLRLCNLLLSSKASSRN